MAVEVKGLAGVVQSIADVKKHSGSIAEELRKNIADAEEALAMTQQLSDQLKSSVVELRGVLGTHTNGAPTEEPKAPLPPKPEEKKG